MKDVPWKNNRKNHQDVQRISILNFLAFSNHRLQNKTHEKYNNMTARNAQFSESGWEMMASRWDQKMSSINKHISRSKNAFKSFNFFWFLWITKKYSEVRGGSDDKFVWSDRITAVRRAKFFGQLLRPLWNPNKRNKTSSCLIMWFRSIRDRKVVRAIEPNEVSVTGYRVLNKVVKLVNSNFSCSPYLIWVCSNENLLSCLSQKFRSAANFYLHVYFIRSLCSPIHDLLKCDWGLYQIFSHENLLLTVWAAFHQLKQNCRFIMTLWRDLLTDWLETCLCITVQCAKPCNILFNYGACKLQLIC